MGSRPLPTVVRLQAEYATVPLWGIGRGETIGELDPEELGLSDGLIERIEAWNQRFQDLPLTNYEWPTREEFGRFNDEGQAIVRELQQQLGPSVKVVYG